MVRAGVKTVVPDGPTNTPPPVEELPAGIIDAPNMLLPVVEFEASPCIEGFPVVEPITGIPVEGTVPPTWRPAVDVASIAPPCPIAIFGFPS